MSDIKDEVVETVDEVIVEDTQVEAEEVIETPDAPLTAARTVSAIQASLAEMSKDLCRKSNGVELTRMFEKKSTL